MTRTGASKRVDAGHAAGRLRKAEAYHEVARLAAEHIGRIGHPDPVVSNAVLAAIGYTDALTAALGGRVNQKDHAAAAKLLRDTLGKALPDAQERRLARLLGRKDDAQYGARPGRSEEAGQVVGDLDAFAAWALGLLRDKGLIAADDPT